MGKKQRAKNKKVSASGKPLVSICLRHIIEEFLFQH